MDIAMFWNRLLTGQEETVYSGGGIVDWDGEAGKDAEMKNKRKRKVTVEAISSYKGE
ncbi:hypothetical protein [Eisenbergiella sp.]